MATEAYKIKQALAAVGVQVQDIYDLANTKVPYPEAIPVLINLLRQGISDDCLEEGVIRALTVKEAKGLAGKALLDQFQKTPKEKTILRWTIGNAMEMVIVEDDLDDVLKIVENVENGISRQMFVEALGKVNSEKSEEVLIKLLDDNEVAVFALGVIGKLKMEKAKTKVAALLLHPDLLIKKEAAKAIKLLNR